MTKNRFEGSQSAVVGTTTITCPERDAMTAVNIMASRIFLYFLLFFIATDCQIPPLLYDE